MVCSQVLLIGSCLLAVVYGAGDPRPINNLDCSNGEMYIADVDSLCVFWQCDHGVPKLRRCAKTVRMPTYFIADNGPVCGITKEDDECLRCELTPDVVPTPVIVVDHCGLNPCRSNCECINEMSGRWCRCDDYIPVTTMETVTSGVDFCSSSPCVNGGICQNNWDQFFCLCPVGFTGRTCESNPCSSNPCQNGGTCVINEAAFHCECTECYGGSCCEDYNCDVNCGRCQDRINGQCRDRIHDCACNACPDPQSICSNSSTGFPRRCDSCPPCSTYNPGTQRCDPSDHLCECNPCNGQVCDSTPFGTQRRCTPCGDCTTFDPSSNSCVENIHECRCTPCRGNQDCRDSSPGFPVSCSCPGCFSFYQDTQTCEADNVKCDQSNNEVCDPNGRCVCPPCTRLLSNGECRRTTGDCQCTRCAVEGAICTSNNDDFGQPLCKSNPIAGRKFTIMYLENFNPNGNRPPLELYMASAGQYDSRVSVQAPGGCWPGGQIVDVSEGNLVQVDIPNDCMARVSGTGTKAITVTEMNGRSLIAYGMNKEIFSADAFLALPDQIAGNFYRVVNWFPLSQQSVGAEFGIVALHDNTEITIELRTADPYGTERITVMLNDLETYLVKDTSKTIDYTGSIIASDKPIHVWSGNIRAAVGKSPDGEDLASRDHLVEAIPHMRIWGRTFVVIPHDRTTASAEIFERVRIVRGLTAPRITCIINEDGYSSEVFIEVGEFSVDYRFSSLNTPVYISCSHSVMVMQFTQSNSPFANELIQDPSMSYCVPTEQTTEECLFSTPNFSGGTGEPGPYDITEMYLVAESNIRAGLVMQHNGGPLVAVNSNLWVKVPGPNNLYGARVSVLHGQTLVTHTGDQSFLCSVGGSADRESYGTVAGMNVKNLTDVTYESLFPY